MAIPTSAYIVLSFLAISTQAASPTAIGKASHLCIRAQTDWWFPRVPTSCCDDNGLCFKWIGPNETNYGVTNLDPEKVIRECSCEKRFHDCITREMTQGEIDTNRSYIFGHLMCFQKTRSIENGVHRVGKYKLYNFLSVLPYIRSKVPSPQRSNRV